MFNITEKAVKDHKSLFNGLNYVKTHDRWDSDEDIHIGYDINLDVDKRWHFAVSVTKINCQWYIHYYNRLVGFTNQEQMLMFGENHHKKNLLHAMYKKDYKDYFDHFKLWQGQIIENYKVNFAYSAEHCLYELKKLVDKEFESKLTYDEDNLYVKLYDRLKRDGVDIPFGVEI